MDLRDNFVTDIMQRSNVIQIGLLFVVLIFFTTDVKCNSVKNLKKKDGWMGFSMSCTNEDPQNVSVSCHGVRIVRRIVQQLLENTAKQRSFELFDGVTLVDTNDAKSSLSSSRSSRLLMGPKSILQFFDGKELRIKLPTFLSGNIESAFRASLPSANQGELIFFVS